MGRPPNPHPLILCRQTMEYIILNRVYTLKMKKIQQALWGEGGSQSDFFTSHLTDLLNNDCTPMQNQTKSILGKY